jgi:hypothetical protein
MTHAALVLGGSKPVKPWGSMIIYMYRNHVSGCAIADVKRSCSNAGESVYALGKEGDIRM